MTKSAMTGLRLPQDILDRADALIPALAHLAAGRASGQLVRSEVLRVALLKGLAELEEETGVDGKNPSGKSARKR